MDDTWIRVSSDELVTQAVNRVRAAGGHVDATDAMSLLFLLPQTHGVLRPESGEATGLNQLVSGTRLFYNPTRATEIGWDAAVAASVFAATGSVTLTSALGIAQRVLRTFKLLDEDEIDMILVMRGLCGSRDPVLTTVTMAQLRAVYEDCPEGLSGRLSSLEKKGVVARTETGWRLQP